MEKTEKLPSERQRRVFLPDMFEKLDVAHRLTQNLQYLMHLKQQNVLELR